MMKSSKIVTLMCALAVFSSCFLGCSVNDGDNGNGDVPPIDYGSYTGVNDKIVDFSKTDGGELFRASNGYGNGGMFDCDWSGGNVLHDEQKDVMRLKITDGGNKVYGSEYQSYKTYGYGYYSVRMKAIKREGVVSSFFTYTRNPQWDEIDIEFLGKDTTKVQFNYFTDGVGKHEKLYNLGFDASEGFHEYGFKWEENKITWYVDGKGVYAASVSIPSHDGKIMMNAWNGKSEGENNVKNWLGTFDKTKFPVPDAEYKWIGYKPLETSEVVPPSEYTVTFHKGDGTFAAGESGIRQTIDGKVTPPDVIPPDGNKFKGWFDAAVGGTAVDFNTKIFTGNTDLYARYEKEADVPVVPEDGWQNISVVGFDGWGNYDIDKTDGLKISHAAKPDDWASCGMDLDVKYSYVKFTVSNNGAQSANFRLDIKKEGANGVVSEVIPSEYYNDYDRGCVIRGLSAGAHADIVCKLDAGNAADKLVVMLNSFDNGSTQGSVTISGLMGIPVSGGGEVKPPVSDYGDYTGVNDKIADFTYGARDDIMERADNWTNGGMFDCVWSADNISHSADTQSLHLSITDDNGTNRASEYRTKQKYSYGYFSVNMKAIKRDGVVTSMFTYTGPSDGTEWHEIDIEILGNDTTKVQFNYYTNGEGGHEYLYDLGFDASEGFHEYAFKWERDKITWYVDGVGVYSATKDIPSVPGKIMINAWTGKSDGEDNVVDWIGAFDRVFPVPDAEYRWIGYKSI